MSRVSTLAHHLCTFAHTNKHTITQQLQGPLTDEDVVAKAWDTSEKRITVIHYTGTFIHTLKLLQFFFPPFLKNNNMCSEKHTDTKNEKHGVVQYILIFTYTQTLASLRMYYAAH